MKLRHRVALRVLSLAWATAIYASLDDVHRWWMGSIYGLVIGWLSYDIGQEIEEHRP